MKLGIIGSGVFGSFLMREISKVAPEVLTFIGEPDTIILAVPSTSYEATAKKFKGKHLINVCSVQAKTNWICSKHSSAVTGIHPLFGPRSGSSERTAIITRKCDYTPAVVELFQKLNTTSLELLGGDGWEHDEVMAKTHVPVVRLQKQIKDIMEQAEGIPIEFQPTSFKRLTEFSQTFGDMPEGTLSSILDNPSIK